MLRAVRGDITTLPVDAIVNAANPQLRAGAGVCGAIHAGAGPALERACLDIPEVTPGVRCPTGEARITPAFALPAKWVIHTVGPIWSGCHADDEAAERCDRLLAACYRNALILADEHACASIAFPCISTGIYGFPPDRAADVAIETVQREIKACQTLADVRFVCFSETDLSLYTDRLT
jgi:O-acetyl-ADP-ribose deacetylase (regulator of RNase III)